MIAIYYSLRSFILQLADKHGRVLCDNTTVVAVVNNMGSTSSSKCNVIAKLIWLFCKAHNIWITCAHIPGVENVKSEFESRKNYKQAEWMLNKKIFARVLQHFQYSPDVDCFAS